MKATGFVPRVFFLLWAAASCGTALAAEANISHRFEVFGRLFPGRSLEAQPGEIAVVRSQAEYELSLKAFGRLPVDLSICSEYIGLRDSGIAVPLPAHLTQTSLGVQATVPFFRVPDTYWRTKVSPSFLTDDFSTRSSALRVPVQSYLIYQPSERWTFVAGVLLTPDEEGQFMPIVGLIYVPHERLTVRLIPDGPNLLYKLNDSVTLFLEAGMHAGEFEVRTDGLRDAVLKYQESSAGAGVQYDITPALRLTVSGGYAFGRRLQYRDSHGKVVIKDAGYGEWRLQYRM